MTMLLVTVAMVLDFGLVRLDRQANKSAADAAVTAGIRGFDQGDGVVYSFRGVCDALTYLKVNKPELASLSYPACGVADNLTKVCDSTAPTSTWASYSSPSINGYTVQIKNPYTLPDTNFPEDSLSSLSSDNDIPCDNLAVIITQTRKPGLGSLATSSNLVTTVRSVGRVTAGAGDQAPALLLLERSKCQVLQVGSAGAPSHIRVYGSVTSAGVPAAATIHSDSAATGAGCGTGSNQQLFVGKQADGVVAYGSTDGQPGTITSFASAEGIAPGIVFDGLSNVYGTTAIDEFGSGTKLAPSGRNQLTRRPVDNRYAAGVRTAIAGANANVWSLIPTPANGWTIMGCPPGNPVQLAAYRLALTAATPKLYVDCPGSITIDSGTALPLIINATEVFFNGFIKGGNVAMPNATAVYVSNPGGALNSSGISLSNGTGFCVRASICDPSSPSIGLCPSGLTSGKAQLFIRQGQIKEGGGILRLCNTTVIMLGGQNVTGCVPTSNGTAPTPTPCAGDTGSGQVAVTGGYQDWTAPNQYDDMSTLTDAQKQYAWGGGEDLALWTESSGGSSSPTFSMAGGGNMHVKGVFMAPNANPFNITGGGTQDLTDAQYVVSSFSLAGGANLKMRVDANNAVAIPKLNPFTLVR